MKGEKNMKNKSDKYEIIFGIIILITGVVSVIIGNKIGVRSRVVFCVLAGIEFGLLFLIKGSDNSNFEKEEEVYKNPMQDRFNKMCDYCNKLEAANYDTYKIFFSSKTKEEIQTWEHEHQITLPKGYKDWLLLSNGLYDVGGTNLYSLEDVCMCPFSEYGEYYIIGSYIGDGSDVVTDKNGVFYKLDHVDGLKQITFESFIDEWVIELLENDMAEAGLIVIENINELFDAYDLFSGTGWEKIRRNIATKCPGVSEVKAKRIEDYLREFYKHCVIYGDELAKKYGAPCLPYSDEAEKEIEEYVRCCKEKYPEIEDAKIRELFGIVCWLTNR